MSELTCELIFAAIQIIIFSFVFYLLLRLLKGTRGISLLLVLMIPVAVIGYLAFFLNMPALYTAAKYILSILPVIIIIVFQQEIRRFLQFVGSPKYLAFRRFSSERHRKDILDSFDEIIDCVCSLTKNKNWRMWIDNPDSNRFKPKLTQNNVGALIAIEGSEELDSLIEQTGTPLNCRLNSLLLQTIFWPGSPLHDGGVVIRGSEILAAACLFPSAAISKSETTHTRHSAAVGLAEHYDAFIIVISEETGTVSITTQDAQLRTVDSPKELLEFMKKRFNVMDKKKNNDSDYLKWWERLMIFITKEINEK